MDKVLSLEQVAKMPLHQLVNAYDYGYRIVDSGARKVSRMSPATCVGTVVQGTTKTNLTMTGSGGTPPYKYEWIVDGAVLQTFTGQTGTKTFSHAFNESVGAHVYKARITDSCPTGAKVAEDLCTITIQPLCTLPTISMNIPA